MIALTPSYLIGFSSFWQATRTPIKSWTGLKFGRIQTGAVELPAPEHLEKSPKTYNGRNVNISAFNFEWIFCILADEKDKYKSFDELKFSQDPISYYGLIIT